MKFTKMQGLGNDYIYIYGLGEVPENIGEIVKKISDRHWGIGSDGVILIDPAEHADFRMRMYNADGSESAMCGNGARCVGKYVYDKGYTCKTDLKLETGAGIRLLTLYPENGRVKSVKVDMGIPELSPEKIPVACGKEKVVNHVLRAEGVEFMITCVSMGNPHAVIFVEDLKNVEIEKWGPMLENHPFFPQRINVEFVEVVSPHYMKMRVWERGTGETLACGTGACASLVAGVLCGKCESEAMLELAGGVLAVKWEKGGHVYMTGEAETVFEGEIKIEECE